MHEWIDHYKSLLNDNKDSFNSNLNEGDLPSTPCPLDFPFTCAEVKLGIRKLKNGKKERPDLIQNEFIKAGTQTLSLTLVKLFNKILISKKIPKTWNHSLITSIFKSGDPTDCNNYRGISVTSCLGKLFTSLLQKRLGDYLETNNLLSPNQGGFREGYRTTDHIYILKTLINKYVYNRKTNLYVCFVDFKKAFDCINRNALLHKLQLKGIGGNFLALIKDMYSNTMYSCKFGNSYSDPFQANLGVKQGDSLSPTLFNVFIDDIINCFSDCTKADPVTLGQYKLNHLLYADDLVLMSESPSGLQHCINALDQYCATWGLDINTQKTKIIVFSKLSNATTLNNFNSREGNLEVVHEYKYLGLIFKSNGKLTYASENLADKARKAYYALKSKIPFSDNLSVKNWIQLYKSVVSPVLTYGSEIWISDFNIKLDNIDKLKFEKTQNMIMKNILGVHSKTSNLALHAELGLLPVCSKVFQLMFKYHVRLTKLDNSNKTVLLKSAFQEDKLLMNQNSPCWLKSIHQLKKTLDLDSLDISYSDFQKNSNDIFINKITSQLLNIRNTESGKLRFFSRIYGNFEMQKYLTVGLGKNLTAALTKIRLSCHPLAIETGRYSKPYTPAEERFCKYCKDVVEDEKHFTLSCPLYDSIRTKFTMFDYTQPIQSEDIIFNILNPSSIQNTKQICLFISEALSTRLTFLNG